MSFNTNNIQSKDIQVIQFIIEDLQKRHSQDKLLKYNVKDKINTILRKRDFKVNKQLIIDIIKSIDIYIDRLEKSKIGNQPIQKNKVNQPSFLNSPISSLLTNSNAGIAIDATIPQRPCFNSASRSHKSSLSFFSWENPSGSKYPVGLVTPFNLRERKRGKSISKNKNVLNIIIY